MELLCQFEVGAARARFGCTSFRSEPRHKTPAMPAPSLIELATDGRTKELVAALEAGANTEETSEEGVRT